MEVENFLGYYALGIQRLAGERSESCAMIKNGSVASMWNALQDEAVS